MWRSSGQVVTAAGRAAPLIAAESPDPVALSVRAVLPEVVMEPATRRRARGPASKRWPALASRSPRGAAHPGNGVIAPFHGGRPRNRGVKDTRRPPFSAPSSRRRPSETAIRTASPALTPRPSRPGGACAGGRGPRPGRRARAGAAMTGDGPRVVGNGAPGGSFRPAPGYRPDETAESCGCRRGRPARGGANDPPGAPEPGPERPARRLTGRTPHRET